MARESHSDSVTIDHTLKRCTNHRVVGRRTAPSGGAAVTLGCGHALIAAADGAGTRACCTPVCRPHCDEVSCVEKACRTFDAAALPARM